MKVRKSKFDSTHTCIFLTEADEKYDKLKPSFVKHGLAFKTDKFIFFDETELRNQGYFNKTYITFIEAHEIAHSVLKHTQTGRLAEAEADFLAVLFCKDKGYKNSAKLGIREFKDRNQISFQKFSEKHKDSILKRVRR